MRESNAGESSREETKESTPEIQKRKSDATSNETVADLEKEKPNSDSTPRSPSVPSPDGSPAAERGSRDSDRSDKGGPL